LWEQEDGVLFVGDDWAEDHHDVEVQDEAGRRLGKAKLAEGSPGSPGCTSCLPSTWMPTPRRPQDADLGADPAHPAAAGGVAGVLPRPPWRPSPSFRPPRRWSFWAGRPIPSRRPRLTTAQITAALKRARRHHAADKAQAIRAALRVGHLTQPTAVVTAYAATV
jgi:hypothetical protein